MQSTFFERDQDALVKCINHYHETGQLINDEKAKKVTNTDQICRKNRERMKPVLEKKRKEKIIAELKRRARKFAGTWREFSNKFGISRLKKSGKITQWQINELKRYISSKNFLA